MFAALWVYCTMFFSLVKRSDTNLFTFMLNLTKNCEAPAILPSPRPYFEKGIFWKEAVMPMITRSEQAGWQRSFSRPIFPQSPMAGVPAGNYRSTALFSGTARHATSPQSISARKGLSLTFCCRRTPMRSKPGSSAGGLPLKQKRAIFLLNRRCVFRTRTRCTETFPRRSA